MRNSLVLMSALCLLIPVLAFGGNAEPKLYLEAFTTDELPSYPPPSYVCSHEEEPGPIQCYVPKARWSYLYLPVHIDNLDETCPIGTVPNCDNYGGYLALALGVASSGEPVLFTALFACPGFCLGPSIAGWPGAIVVAAIDDDCHDRWDHPLYLVYANHSCLTGATYFDIVDNADGMHNDMNHHIINCSHEYDANTVIACRAQWGGDKDITCGEIVAVEATTWGRIKALYR
ncbi:MAG: hypothetical protein AMJ46_06260 [Latescibacteria bacterium DG_63]|nr:MAG: hypothetical protein AMJ46_06260 [Latescibacteria bacterium DG_63]